MTFFVVHFIKTTYLNNGQMIINSDLYEEMVLVLRLPELSE